MDGAEGCIVGLGGALLAIAAKPARVGRLHHLLEQYVHRFRNRLNCMKMSLYLAKREEASGRLADWLELEARYRTLEQFMDQLQLFCGAASLQPVRAPLGVFLGERRESWHRCLAARGRVLELVPSKDQAIGEFDPSRLGQCLDALAEWRAEMGSPETIVRVSCFGRNDHLHLVWEEPGTSLYREPVGARAEPTCLALPMLARVMAAHRGTLEIAMRGGVRLCLRWPIDLSRSPTEA